MESTIVLFVVSLLVGLGVGVLAGLLGVGGGTLLVPAFKLGYAMDSLMCTATSLFTIIPTSISGAFSHIRHKTCLPKLGLAAGLGGACLSPVGVWLASLSPDWCVMGAAAIIIAYSSITMFRKALKAPKTPRRGSHSKTTETEPPAAEANAAGMDLAEPAAAESNAAQMDVAWAPAAGSNAAHMDVAGATTPEANLNDAENAIAEQRAQLAALTVGPREMGIAALIGLFAGLASGYVGVGGGFIMVPLLMSMLRVPMKLTSGTSLIAVMILAVPGVITQAFMGNINWIAGIAVACGSIPGAQLGAKLIPKIPERQLRFTFAGFLVVAAVLLVVNQLGLWG